MNRDEEIETLEQLIVMLARIRPTIPKRVEQIDGMVQLLQSRLAVVRASGRMKEQ
jgi:hypothetical protein